jgi:hypothetical protein
MKRLLIVIIALALLVTIAYANNAARIKDLQAQQQVIAQEIDKAQKMIQQKQFELVRIQGAIDELQKQDSVSAVSAIPAAPAEKK